MNNSNLRSSENNITGDIPTSLKETILYCFNFLIELLKSKKYNGSENIEPNREELIKFWGSDKWENYSPARIACDMFLVIYLSNNFTKEETINVLDVGCGMGHYSTLFRNLGFNIKYTGIDLHEKDTWRTLQNETTRFFQIELGEGNSDQLDQIASLNIDLIFSHSCLEHIKNDISALLEIRDSQPSARQLHLVPATISFLNYFKHGFRRYSEKNFVKVSKYFDGNIKTFTLGNHFLVSSYFNFFYKKYNKKHKFDFFNLYKKEADFIKILGNISPKEKNYPVYYAIEMSPRK